ncbi:branched-chain amino acid transport system II carrier protein [Levilactobacillus brevis]|jgi:LIVCS family branched-chain amino acid:cation transporter|uniref:Branched-chain amino acid transport system carrier protein n=4 Tax=Bacillati TaxID=1783272 RepID=Q03NP6_LEVBA|nr:branched-chain amino acid transport system II carrier protein [Levilactobacillus brevis]MBL3537131.1 branched-chain amino acid transport system II carrier protein [Lactobacillus sp. GPR40-2]MBL3630289.1 branched-chain amino acid transport system II carrier protein [Lactobacillus sp. GPB7-4]ABJ65176.1 Branched-chain amino acid permease [Levilactobacillus brevis ATCC 367]ARQ92758.1 branched-chain amino acid transporter II carrier protein [Levilactobacillus brevis]ARW51715.1 Branched-chain ami
MEQAEHTQHNFWQLLVVSSLIFGMFFGSGNLIFPVHLGQMAGQHWFSAALGFAVSGSLFPLLAILAVVVTKSDGLYDLAKPVGRHYAAFFLVMVHLTIGPFFGTPRTAATAFQMAAEPFLPQRWTTVGQWLFTAGFFGLAYLIAIHQNSLIKWIGKYLNALFLALLAVIFVVAFCKPMGSLNHTPSVAYQSGATISGLLEGYNTIDAVALLALSVTFVHAVRALGYHDRELTKLTAKAGTLAIVVEVLVYFGLVLLGAFSLGELALSANGGVALSQIVGHYFSNLGTAFLGILVTLGVFTTALGLVTSFAQDFHKLFPKVSYLTWLRTTTIASFLVANVGLDNIIAWSLPVLMLLYPLSLALILVSLTVAKWAHAGLIYKLTIVFTAVPAVLDMLANSPAVVTNWAPIANLLRVYHTYVPFASLGLGWLVPTLAGFTLGIVWGHWRLVAERMTEDV